MKLFTSLVAATVITFSSCTKENIPSNCKLFEDVTFVAKKTRMEIDSVIILEQKLINNSNVDIIIEKMSWTVKNYLYNEDFSSYKYDTDTIVNITVNTGEVFGYNSEYTMKNVENFS